MGKAGRRDAREAFKWAAATSCGRHAGSVRLDFQQLVRANGNSNGGLVELCAVSYPVVISDSRFPA